MAATSIVALNNIAHLLCVDLSDKFHKNYKKDQIFAQIYETMKGILPTEKTQFECITFLLPLFKLEDGQLYYTESCASLDQMGVIC